MELAAHLRLAPKASEEVARTAPRLGRGHRLGARHQIWPAGDSVTIGIEASPTDSA